MHAAWKLDQGDRARKEVSMAKVHVANTLHQAADVAIQLQGARGYSKDTVVEWVYRAAARGAAGRRRRRSAQDGAGEIHARGRPRFLAVGPGRGARNSRHEPADNAFDPERDTALVTGAGNGIGRAIAQALVGEGVRTVFADVIAGTRRRRDRGVAAAGAGIALGRRSGASARPAMPCSRMRADARPRHAFRPQRLAAAARGRPRASAVSDETWERMRAVNVDAGFHLAREIARALIAAKRAGLVPDADVAARRDAAQPACITARSKAALAMLVKELAKTLGRYNIRVNALVPGAIAAGGFVADPALARHIPLGRLGKSEDLAPMALAVLSNRISGYVTGAAIVVDGGLCADQLVRSAKARRAVSLVAKARIDAIQDAQIGRPIGRAAAAVMCLELRRGLLANLRRDLDQLLAGRFELDLNFGGFGPDAPSARRPPARSCRA